MKFHRLLAGALAISLLAVGCGADGNNTSNNGETTDGKNLKVFYAGGEGENVIDVQTNEFTKWAEEQTGIHVEFEWVDFQSAEEQLNLLLSSGVELPDIILAELNSAQLIQYGGEGLLIPLNDLLEQYGTNAKKFAKEFADDENFSTITAPDGNIYGMPSGEACYHCKFSQKMWINQTWLEALNLDMPTTTDEFYEVLKAFKEKDPNGNGQADEIPLSACTEWWHATIPNFIMNAFIYYDDETYLSVENGTVIPVAIQTEWKDGLAYLKKLYDEGLLDTEAFVQKPEQLRQLVENGGDIALGATPTGTPASFADDTGEATKNFVTVPPLTGPNGVRTVGYYQNQLMTRGVVTRDCKDPALAVQWLDFLLSEDATMRQAFGVEGIDWEKAGENDVGLSGETALFKEINVLPGMTEQNQGVELMTGMTEKLFNGRAIDANDPWYIEKRLADETEKNYDIGIEPTETLSASLFMSIEDAQKYDEISVPLREHLKENVALFITGNRSLDEWDDYVEEAKSLGYNEYVAIAQKYYDETK